LGRLIHFCHRSRRCLWHDCNRWGRSRCVVGIGAVGGAAVGANNNIVAQTGKNFEGFNQIHWDQVGISAAIGGVSGAAGAGAGHIAGGTTANLFASQDFGEAFSNSFKGIWTNMAIGGVIGVVTTIGVSYASGVSPLTGKSLSAPSTSNNKINSYTYDERVRMRALDDPTSHNFPYSFDESILSTTPIVKPDGYMIYQLNGTMNGINGYYEIGVTKGGIINHRFFRPIK
jgi:hypothetical protein